MPAFENLKEMAPERKLTGLSDANSRYTYYEAIREVADPSELRLNDSKKSLSESDYLMEAPIQNQYLLSNSRLVTLKENIEKFRQDSEKMNVLAEKNAQFIASLLGN